MELKTKSMLYMMEPIAKYVSYLDHLSSSPNSINKSLIVDSQKIDEVCSKLLLDSEKDLEPYIENLKLAFIEFHRSVDSKQDSVKIHVDNMIGILLAVHKMLVKKDYLEIEKISEAVKDCHSSLLTLEKNTTEEEIRVHLKQFSQMSEACMSLLMARAQELVSKKQRQLILLCANQISKCLPCLLSILKQEMEYYSPEAPKMLKSYIVKRISWCFSELLNIVQAPKPSIIEENEGCGGQFVLRMDLALDLLTSSSKMLPAVELKPVVDEVLCHAMSIVQVAVASDGKAITASCQKVLRSLEELKKEYSCSAVNPSICNLYASSLADSLEALEQRVNTALLRLVLEVFCDPFSPLMNLLEYCKRNIPESERHSQDLEDMISVFDLQMDRIMQIGLFAMACSEDVKRVLGIRSCLASLESLEPELIPALTSHYLEPSKISCKYYLKELVLLWKSEVDELQKFIDGIVDPAAFCQVTIDDIHLLVTNLKSQLYNTDKLVLKEIINAIIKRSKKLLQHLKISQDDDPQHVSPSLIKVLSDLQFACSECDAAVRLLLPEGNVRIHFMTHSRLLKRCELLLSLMKKLHVQLVEMSNSTEMKTISTSIQNMNAPKEQEEGDEFLDSIVTCNVVNSLDLMLSDFHLFLHLKFDDEVKEEVMTWFKRQVVDFYDSGIQKLVPRLNKCLDNGGDYVCKVKLCTGDSLLFPENPSDLPVDEHSCLSLSEDGGAIAHLLMKGKLLIRERSILYFTPKSKAHLTPVIRPVTIQRTPCVLFSRSNLPEVVEPDVEVDLSLSLEITSILDKFTSLSNTLTSERSGENIDMEYQSISTTQTKTVQFLTNSVQEIAKNPLPSVGCAIDTDDNISPVSMGASNSSFMSVTSASSLTSHEVNTPQRMEDLKTVQEKIAALKIL